MRWMGSIRLMGAMPTAKRRAVVMAAAKPRAPRDRAPPARPPIHPLPRSGPSQPPRSGVRAMPSPTIGEARTWRQGTSPVPSRSTTASAGPPALCTTPPASRTGSRDRRPYAAAAASSPPPSTTAIFGSSRGREMAGAGKEGASGARSSSSTAMGSRRYPGPAEPGSFWSGP